MSECKAERRWYVCTRRHLQIDLSRNEVRRKPEIGARRLLPSRLRRATSLPEGGLSYTILIQISVFDAYKQLIPKGFLREEAVGAAD